jgi:hypothetical protein
MNYKILDLHTAEEWNQIIKKLPLKQQDIYFTPEYYELYEKNDDGKALCFIFEDSGDIALYPFLINSVNELDYELDDEYFDIQGAYGYNGVIASNYVISFRKAFYKQFEQYCIKSNIIAEFTRFNPILGNYQFADRFMDVIYDRKTVYLNLEQPYDDIWTKQYSSKNRNMIKKAHKTNLQIKYTDNINSFYNIYTATMQKIGADQYYFFNKNYFKNLKVLINKNSYILEVIDLEDRILCSMILLIYGKYAHYHLSGRASDNKNNSANNFILDEAIKFALNKGCKIFHFGGGNSYDENDSLLKFKRNFSKDIGFFYIGKKIYNQQIYDKVVEQWEQKYPEKVEKNKHILLKYRYF